MKGTKKFQRDGAEWEVMYTTQFHNESTGKYYVAKLVEPVEQELLEKLGTMVLEKEVYFKEGNDIGTFGKRVAYKIYDMPPGVQGLLAELRRAAIYERRNEHIKDSLSDVLGSLVEAGIAERLPDGIMPEGIGAVMFKPEGNSDKKWKLFDKNSDMEMPWGEILRTPDGEEYELLKGTRKTHITIRDEHGVESLVQPGLFDLEWREVRQA